MNKKAQITYFIIAGVIILIAIGVFLIPKMEVTPIDEEVDVELGSIYNFVTSCMNKIALEGVTTISSQGGFIDSTGFINIPVVPTESEVIENPPGSGFYIPYWNYMKSANTCTGNCLFESLQPPLCKNGCKFSGEGSIEEQLQNYIELNMGSCINGFESIKDMDVKTLGESKVAVKIINSQINIDLTYPLEINIDEKMSKVSEFHSSIRSPISEFYNLANDITEYEKENCFLEKGIMNAISLYGGVDSEKLPPISDDSEKYVMWVKPKVENKISSLTYNILKIMKFYNTSNSEFYKPKEDEEYPNLRSGIMNQFMQYPFKDYHDVIVNLYYFPWQKPYLDILPNSGSVITPSKSLDFLPDILTNFISINPSYEYRYSYMYSFPVVVEILKWNKELQKSDVFRFGLEANIRGNKCFKGSDKMEFFSNNQDSLLCDMNFRSPTEYKLSVVNDYNGTVIDNAHISFYSGDECQIGITNVRGKLNATLPIADSGLIIVKKDGFISNYYKYLPGGATNINIKLKPLFKKTVEIRKITNDLLNEMISSSDITKRTQGKGINDSDMITLTVERQTDGFEGESSDAILIDENTTKSSILITKGKYSVLGQLIVNENLSLPKEYNRVCVSGNLISGSCIKTPKNSDCVFRGDSTRDFEMGDCYKEGYTCESIISAWKKGSDAVTNTMKWACGLVGTPSFLIGKKCIEKKCEADEEIVYPAINLSILPLGGVKLDEETMLFEINDYDSIVNADKIIVYMYEADKPDRIHKLENFVKYINVSQKYPRLLMPELE